MNVASWKPSGAHAKEGTYKLERLVINSLILQTLKFSHTGEALKIKISHNLAKDIWSVLGDPNQMKQMLVNILTNAFEAMEEKGGTLKVETRNVIKKTDWQDAFNNVHPKGSYVSIEITNSGPEIPGEIATQIFEPFYTTKSLGRGLGLAAVAGIVQNHGGCVSFESSEAGTTFLILLPRAETKGNHSDNELLHQTTMTPKLNRSP
jgi:signal transduction histidine kinase